MSVQSFATDHALSVQMWSEGLEAEALKKVSYTGLIGKRSDALIQWKDGMSSKPGDTETIGLRMQLSNAPKTSTDSVENNEQTLEIYHMTVTLDEVVDAVKFKNVIDRQRVNFDMLDEAKAALADQLANAWDTSMFNQLAGFFIAGMKQTFHGNNAVNGPDSTHQIIAGNKATEQLLVAGDDFTLDHIDWAKEKAKTLSPSIRPARIAGFNRPLYCCFIHPYQMTQLRKNDSRWSEVMNNAMRGGVVNANPLITGACGIWNETLICESDRVPFGIDDSGDAISTVRRAIFCGAQSAVVTWGRLGGDPKRFRWVEKQFDFDREYGVMAGFLGGIKKMRFNNSDFSSVVISTHATASG